MSSSPDKAQNMVLLDFTKSIKPNKAPGPAKSETIQINPNSHNFFANGKLGNGGAGPTPRGLVAGPFHHHHLPRMANGFGGGLGVAGHHHHHGGGMTTRNTSGHAEPIVLKPTAFPTALTGGFVSSTTSKKKGSPSSSVSSCSSSSASCSTNCSSLTSSCATHSSCNSSCASMSSSKASSVCSTTSGGSGGSGSTASSSSMMTRSSKLFSAGAFSSSASMASTSTLNDQNSSRGSDDSGTLSPGGSTTSSSSSSLASPSHSDASIISSSSNDEDSGPPASRTANKRKLDLHSLRRSFGAVSRAPLHTKTNLNRTIAAGPGRHLIEERDDEVVLSKKPARSSTGGGKNLHNDSQNSIEVICLDDDDDDVLPVTAKSPVKETRLTVPPASSANEEPRRCLWKGCSFVAKRPTGGSGEHDPAGQLVEHVKACHVHTQKKSAQYRCLWANCKIYDQPSMSNGWLERHVVEHVDKCPFPCLLNGCKRKFRTEQQREKHIQNHMNSSENHNTSFSNSPSPIKTRKHASAKSSSSTTAAASRTELKRGAAAASAAEPEPTVNVKNLRKHPAQTNAAAAAAVKPVKDKEKTKKRRNNGHSESAPRKFIRTQFKDFVDQCTMRVIEKRLNDLDFQSGVITFTPRIVGIETNQKDQSKRYLIEWQPPNIIKTEWLERNQLTETKTVALSELRALAVTDSTNQFYRPHRFRPNRRK